MYARLSCASAAGGAGRCKRQSESRTRRGAPGFKGCARVTTLPGTLESRLVASAPLSSPDAAGIGRADSPQCEDGRHLAAASIDLYDRLIVNGPELETCSLRLLSAEHYVDGPMPAKAP